MQINTYIRILIALILLSLISLFSACSTPEPGGLLVAVTILPQQEFVEKICGGQSLEIMTLIPPGASPETYELKPAQMQKLSGAGIYFALGSGLQFENNWLDKISHLNPNMKIVDCSKGIEIMTGSAHSHEAAEHNGRDPHVWCSPANARLIIKTMAGELAAIFPDKAGLYEANAAAYLEKLARLDGEIKDMFAAAANRDFLIFHPAWGYFARDYGLNQIAIEVEGKEPHATELSDLVRQAKEKNIKTVFASPQFNTSSAEMIASDIGGRVEFIDPLAKDYVGNLLQVAVKIRAAME